MQISGVCINVQRDVCNLSESLLPPGYVNAMTMDCAYAIQQIASSYDHTHN